MDTRAQAVQARPDPPNAGTKHLERFQLRIRGELTAAVSRSATEAVGSHGSRLISPRYDLGQTAKLKWLFRLGSLVLLSHEAGHLEAGPSRGRLVFQHEARRCPSTRGVKR